jgi:hypothetical protein
MKYSSGIIGIGIVQGFSVLIIVSLLVAVHIYSINMHIERSLLKNFRHEEVRIACAESMLVHIIRRDTLPVNFEKNVYGHICRRLSFEIVNNHIDLETETNFSGVVVRMRTIYSVNEKRIISIKNI